MQAKIENWLEAKLERRENSHGPVEIFLGEIECWAGQILDIFYGDDEMPPDNIEGFVMMIDQWLDKRGK